MVDVYQTQTVMTDESEQSFPFTPNTLLDRALGAQGYYGAFTANMHTDAATTFESSQLLASAQDRGVPVITARQLLTWTDGRNGSSFADLAWSGSTLSFSLRVGSGASRLTAMLPTSGPGGTTLSGLTRDGTAVPFTPMTVKGQEYATFAAAAGSWSATYAAGGSSAPVAARVASTVADGTTVAWRTGTPATSTVRYGTSAGSLDRVASAAERTTRHRMTIPGLAAGRAYHYRVVSRTPDGRTRSWPRAGLPPATFRTAALDRRAPTPTRVRALSLPDGTARVTWSTRTPSASVVRFTRPSALPSGLRVQSRLDDRLVRRHEVVLTGLRPRSTYWLTVESTDVRGRSAASRPVTLRTRGPGVALQTALDFRTGRVTGDLRVGDAGFGRLVVPSGGSGTFWSAVQDTRAKVRWTAAVVRRSGDARLVLSVRTGDLPRPDRSWSAWRPVRGGHLDRPGRYLQLRLRLTAAAGSRASISAVGVEHDGAAPETIGEVS